MNRVYGYVLYSIRHLEARMHMCVYLYMYMAGAFFLYCRLRGADEEQLREKEEKEAQTF